VSEPVDVGGAERPWPAVERVRRREREPRLRPSTGGRRAVDLQELLAESLRAQIRESESSI